LEDSAGVAGGPKSTGSKAQGLVAELLPKQFGERFHLRTFQRLAIFKLHLVGEGASEVPRLDGWDDIIPMQMGRELDITQGFQDIPTARIGDHFRA
jgi:hypothetical protein